MLTMRIMPKMSESPPASKKSRAPYETPLKSWLIQKSNGQATPKRSLPKARARISTVGARVTAGDCTIAALSGRIGGPRETAARALRLLTDREPAPLAASAGGAHGGVDRRERGGVGHG